METLQQLIDAFANDPTVKAVGVLIFLDVVLGVSAALYTRTFRFGWLSDFLRRDVLGKVVPYFAVWAAVRVGGDLEIAGYGAIEEGVGLFVVAALGSSVLNSLRDLGIGSRMSDVIAGSDHRPPAP